MIFLKNSHSKSTIIAIILFAYVILVGGYILFWNQYAGGLVQGWHHEYIDANGQLQGSGKWRVSSWSDNFTGNSPGWFSRDSFPGFAFVYGTWIYPCAIVASSIFIRKAFSEKEKKTRNLFFAGAFSALIILSCFIYLGVFRAVSPFH